MSRRESFSHRCKSHSRSDGVTHSPDSIGLPTMNRVAHRAVFREGENRIMPPSARPTNLRKRAARQRLGFPIGQARDSRQLPASAAVRREELFPGIVGYDSTVIPEINIAILAEHDMLFLGEKGPGQKPTHAPAGPLSRREDSLHRPSLVPRPRRPVPPDLDGRPPPHRRPARRESAHRLVAASSAMPNGCRPAPSSPTSSAKSIRPSSPAASVCRPRKRCTSASSRGCIAGFSP